MFKVGDEVIIIFTKDDWFGHIANITEVPCQPHFNYQVRPFNQKLKPGNAIMFYEKNLIKATKINKILYGFI